MIMIIEELFEEILEHRFESLKKQRQIFIDNSQKYKEITGRNYVVVFSLQCS